MEDHADAHESTLPESGDGPGAWTFGRIVGRAAGILGIFTAVAVAAIGVVFAFGIPLNLSFLGNRIESAATRALGRDVSIAGPVRLLPGTWPSVEMQGLKIANPPDWDTREFTRIKKIRGGIALFPLLKREIRISQILVEGLEVNLVARPDGANNWDFNDSNRPASDQGVVTDKVQGPALHVVEIKNLGIRDAHVRYKSPDSPEAAGFKIDAMTVAAAENENIQASLRATFLEQAFSLSLKGGGIGDLLAKKPAMSISRIEGSLGETVFSGTLDLSLATTKARIAGELIFDTLDMGMFATGQRQDRAEAPESPTVAGGWNIPIGLDSLQAAPLDLNLKLAVNRVLNAPLEIRDSNIDLTLEGGHLTAPGELTLAGSRLTGMLDIDAREQVPRLAVTLTTQGADLGRMAHSLGAAEDVEAKLGHFKLTAGSRGADLKSMLKALDLDMKIKASSFAYGGDADKRPVNLSLKSAGVALSPEKGLTVAAGGELLGENFKLNLAAAGLAGLLENSPWPVELSLSGAGAELGVSGHWVRPSPENGPFFDLLLTGSRIGDLAPWVGLAPAADAAYELRGSYARFKHAWRVDFKKAAIGQFALSGHLGVKRLGSENPLLTVALTSDDVDPAEVRGFFKKERPGADSPVDTSERQFTIDMPILPHQFELKDADIEIAVGRLRMRPVDITGISLAAKVRNGRVESAPFTATMANAGFKGYFSLDMTGKLPQAVIELTTGRIDIGAFFAALGIAESLDAAANSIEVNMVARGKSLDDMLKKGDLKIDVTDGRWTLHDANTQAGLDIGIAKASYRAMTGEPRRLTIDGRIGEIPLEIGLEIDPVLPALARGKLPFSLKAAASGARVELNGLLDLPLSNRNLGLKMVLGGEKLDSLNPLLGVSLPPLGPYRMEGDLQVGSQGYSLENLLLRVGSSKLSGGMNLQTTAEHPLLTAALVADTVQLDDFRVGGWSPLEEPQESRETPSDSPTATASIDKYQEGTKSFLNPALMNGFDADLGLQVKEVFSGEDSLGSGRLKMVQQGGRLTIDDLELHIPGGSISLSGGIEIREQETAARVKAHIDRLDYGIIARRASPTTNATGLVSLNLDIESRAAGFQELMTKANGHFDFALEPENLPAGVMDLWAVNLVAAVLPIFNPTRDSKINCAVARFNLKDGIMREKTILVDTSKIQVRGKGQIDFKTQTVDIKLTPRPKRPQFFSMATPVHISGGFDNFGMGITPTGLIGTVIRFATSYITVPIQWLIFNKLPKDGSQACTEAVGKDRISANKP